MRRERLPRPATLAASMAAASSSSSSSPASSSVGGGLPGSTWGLTGWLATLRTDAAVAPKPLVAAEIAVATLAAVPVPPKAPNEASYGLSTSGPRPLSASSSTPDPVERAATGPLADVPIPTPETPAMPAARALADGPLLAAAWPRAPPPVRGALEPYLGPGSARPALPRPAPLPPAPVLEPLALPRGDAPTPLGEGATPGPRTTPLPEMPRRLGSLAPPPKGLSRPSSAGTIGVAASGSSRADLCGPPPTVDAPARRALRPWPRSRRRCGPPAVEGVRCPSWPAAA
mmetsp:Transcript_2410/g.9480  ORF Transcript_2410/g.9480 Transcript_2410/m.9480 type:complete len:287 (-) Transcript_2410:15-875(-)